MDDTNLAEPQDFATPLVEAGQRSRTAIHAWCPDAVGGAQHSRPAAPAADCSGTEDMMINSCLLSSHLLNFGMRMIRMVAFKGFWLRV